MYPRWGPPCWIGSLNRDPTNNHITHPPVFVQFHPVVAGRHGVSWIRNNARHPLRKLRIRTRSVGSPYVRRSSLDSWSCEIAWGYKTFRHSTSRISLGRAAQALWTAVYRSMISSCTIRGFSQGNFLLISTFCAPSTLKFAIWLLLLILCRDGACPISTSRWFFNVCFFRLPANYFDNRLVSP